MVSAREFISLVEKKDLRPALIKAGWHPELVEWAYSVSPKYTPFVLNLAFLRELNKKLKEGESTFEPNDHRLIEVVRESQEIILKLFQEQFKPKLPKKPNNLTRLEAWRLLGQLQTIQDWAGNPEVNVRLQALEWDEALAQSRQWHAEIAQRATGSSIKTKEGQEVVILFNDRSYWLSLGTSYCRDEADAMGHCGQANVGELYSLRDVQGVPKVTADIDEDNKIAGQIFCKGNSKPPKKYHRKILELLGELEIESVQPERQGEESFSINDLSSEDKEWFEETYGYELRGSVTIDMVASALDDAMAGVELDYVSWTADDDSGYYLGIFLDGSIPLPQFITDFLENVEPNDIANMFAAVPTNSGMLEVSNAYVSETLYREIPDYVPYATSDSFYETFDASTDTNHTQWVKEVATGIKDEDEYLRDHVDAVITHFVEEIVAITQDEDYIPNLDPDETEEIIRLGSFLDLVSKHGCYRELSYSQSGLYSATRGRKELYMAVYGPRVSLEHADKGVNSRPKRAAAQNYAKWINKKSMMQAFLSHLLGERSVPVTEGISTLPEDIPQGSLDTLILKATSTGGIQVMFRTKINPVLGSFDHSYEKLIPLMGELTRMAADYYSYQVEHGKEPWFNNATKSMVDRGRRADSLLATVGDGGQREIRV